MWLYTPSFLSMIPIWAWYLILSWCIVWKGLALWKAAVNRDKIWFVVLLVLNTVGLLDILYIFIFSKREYREDKDIKSK